MTTIEGLREHPLVEAFVRADAVQCGYCTPGQVVSAAALVAANPQPTREEMAQIRELLEAARDLWRTLPEAEDDSERRIVARTAVRLIQIADTVAVTSS